MKAALHKLSGVFRKRPADPMPGGQAKYSLWARFIFQSGHYRKLAPAQPKPNAFLPGPLLKTSAIWRDALLDREIWEIGALLGSERQQQPKARADLGIAAISEANLTIEPDPAPHPRHFNLCGWPTEKDEQKAIAMVLCANSSLVERKN